MTSSYGPGRDDPRGGAVTETSAVRQPPARPPIVGLGLEEEPSGDTRRMAPIYAAVLALEAVVLLSIWWFQQHFGG
jgi:hypothetical protein